MEISLIVNPIAGLGGAVGLKGTDGPDTVAEALRRGAKAQSGYRARAAFQRLADRVPGIHVRAAPGRLGADWLEGLDLKVGVLDVGPLSGTARDTRLAIQGIADTDLVVFAGGDETARDVTGALSGGSAVLGIPCGVKMHSAVFAVSPGAAGAVMATLSADQDRIGWIDDAEVMDIDEAALRQGVIAPRLFGYARVPMIRSLMQAAKGGPPQDAAAALASAARSVAREMDPGILYIVGPGTSAGAVMQAAGHAPTVLGTDALLDGKVVARDAQARELEDLSRDRQVRIVLGVTGQQGFLLGRGNQQIGRNLIEKAGRAGLIVLATEAKLSALAQPRLWVDTGDPELDRNLAGFIRVQTGKDRQMMMRIGSID